MGLKHRQEEQHHQDGEQDDVVCCLPFQVSIFKPPTSKPPTSKSKVNERTKARSIECSHAENEHDGSHNPHPDVLTVAVVGVVDLLFQLLTPSRQGEEGEEGSDDQGGIYHGVTLEDEAAEVEGEHAGDKGPGHIEVLDAEEHPDDANRDEGEDDRRHRADFLHHLTEEEFVEADEETMQCTPDDEVPRGTVPQTAKQEAQPEVEVHATCAFAVAAERNVEVVHDESAKGFMPTSPELCDAA